MSYKVVFRADAEHSETSGGITWEPGCPLLVSAVQISRNTETGEAFLQSKVRNIGAEQVSSFKMSLRCTYQNGSVDEFEVEPLDADIAPNAFYTPRAVALPRGDVKVAGATVDSLETPSGRWSSAKQPLPLPQREPLALSKQALAERVLQLKEHGCKKSSEAAPYATSYHPEGGWAQCACGRISVGPSMCPDCGLYFANAAAQEDESLLKKASAKRSDDEAKAKAELKRQKKKWGVIAAVAALALCAIFAGAYALMPTTAFAVYSSDDKSLTFYRGKTVPESGSVYEGKRATFVYEDIEDSIGCEWADSSLVDESRTVVFAGEVQPISCSEWFAGMSNCTTVEGIDKLDTSRCTDFSGMFHGCNSLTSLDVSGFDTSLATDFSYMFSWCENLTSLDVSGFDTSQATNFHGMFSCCKSLTSLDVSGFDTSQATDLRGMFQLCKSLTSLDVSGFDTSLATDFSYMFSDCESLTSLDVSGFDTSLATDFGNMFSDCESLTSLDVSGFDTSLATDFGGMFSDCTKLSADCSSWTVSFRAPRHFNSNAPGVIVPSAWDQAA